MDAQFSKFYELLKKWNKHLNLTAVDDEKGFEEKHLKDSLTVLPYIEDAKTLVDLGTGAGLPGIILKISRPDLFVALVDSTRKKISFCDEAIRQLGLKDIKTVWGRAEDENVFGKLPKFDVVVSRATWELKKFLPIAKNYLAFGGKMIAMKGPRWDEELKNAETLIKELSLELVINEDQKLSSDITRRILIFKEPLKNL